MTKFNAKYNVKRGLDPLSTPIFLELFGKLNTLLGFLAVKAHGDEEELYEQATDTICHLMSILFITVLPDGTPEDLHDCLGSSKDKFNDFKDAVEHIVSNGGSDGNASV